MSEPTPIDLPVGLRWVKLVCRLGRLVTDSAADADAYPDLLPVGGTLTLAASPSRVRIQEADGRWRSVEVAGRTYTIRSDGELVDNEGRVGVWIPDPASLLVEPQGYAVTAVVKPIGGTDWRVTFGGSTVLPDVVDLVAVSSVGSVSPSVTASLDARIYSLEQGGGVDVSQVVEDYLVANPPAAVADATTTTKGILRLAGDLGGTATAPTVPGLASKANTTHGHAIGDVTGLQTALDGKQASGSYAAATHEHTAGDIDSGAATDGHVLTADGAGGAVWEAPPAGDGGDVGQAVEDYLAANPPAVGGGNPLAQIGTLTLPANPQPGESVTVVADSGTTFPTGISWDAAGPPEIATNERLLVYLVWGGADWIGTYGLPITTVGDMMPPTGTLSVTVTNNAATLTVNDAADTGSGLHAQPYRFSIDGGVTWTDWQASSTWTSGVLAQGTHHPSAQVRDTATVPNLLSLVGDPIVIGSPPALAANWVGQWRHESANRHATFPDINVGPAFPGRLVVVAVGNGDTAGRLISGVTIGGVAATLGNEVNSFGGARLAWAVVPDGTSIDIVVDRGTDAWQSRIAVWVSNVPAIVIDTHAATLSGTAPATATLDSTGGAVIAAFYARNGLTSATWDGATDIPVSADSPQLRVASGPADEGTHTLTVTATDTQGRRFLAATIGAP